MKIHSVLPVCTFSWQYSHPFLLTYMYMYVFVYFSYALLTPETYPSWNGRVQDGVKHLLLSVNMEPDQWQLGRTKIFVKSPESVGVLHVCVCVCVFMGDILLALLYASFLKMMMVQISDHVLVLLLTLVFVPYSCSCWRS